MGNLRQCIFVCAQLLAVARNRFCGPVERDNVSLRSGILVRVSGIFVTLT